MPHEFPLVFDRAHGEPWRDNCLAIDYRSEPIFLKGRQMIQSLLRSLGVRNDTTDLEKLEPIYGLTKQSLDAWLSRNPGLKKDYQVKLSAHLQRDRVAGSKNLVATRRFSN